MMSKNIGTKFLICYVLLILATLFFYCGVCQDDGEIDNNSGAIDDLYAQLVYDRISNITAILTPEIAKTFSFCIRNVNADWNSAFDFSGNLSFLSNCARKTNGNLVQRLCTAAEINIYFSSVRESGSMASSHWKSNRNCNLTTWLSGCQPGWACSVGSEQKVNLRDSKDIPDRTDDCQPCCEGFFCPHGLTCMIPCPLGSYCPLGLFNKVTGVCDPYRYQLPQGQPNHTCGGADIWADISSSGEVFCPGGSYCPSTVEKVACSSGHYCRTGSTYQSPLLCKIAALRSFSLDKLHYWRESSSGMSSLAFFLAKDTIDLLNTIIKPLCYLSLFYFFNNPRSSVPENYAVLLCLVYCVTGIAYVLAIFFEPGPAQLWSVLLPVVLTLIATQENRNKFLKRLQSLCYTKWALEAFVIANAQRYAGVWLITRCGALYEKGYDVNDWGLSLCVLIGTGVISRIVAFMLMVLFQRK